MVELTLEDVINTRNIQCGLYGIGAPMATEDGTVFASIETRWPLAGIFTVIAVIMSLLIAPSSRAVVLLSNVPVIR